MPAEYPRPEMSRQQIVHLSPRTFYRAELLGKYLGLDIGDAIKKAVDTLVIMVESTRKGDRWISDSTVGNIELDIDKIISTPFPAVTLPDQNLFRTASIPVPEDIISKLTPLALAHHMTLEEVIQASFQLIANIRERYIAGEIIILREPNGREREAEFFTDHDDDPLY